MFTKITVSPQKLQQRGTLSLPPACCSPSSYEGLTMLYLDGVDENGRQVKIYLFFRLNDRLIIEPNTVISIKKDCFGKYSMYDFK